MSNHLKDQTSPYLLQHAENPVDWYPWCSEAFDRARKEDKPVFLSIGYSTCHWCHVMAHESFEDVEIAAILNEHYISIKVDREERPDIDSVYMAVCQAFTGSGGWPTSIFMTADQKPFFAGTYFPRSSRHGMIGFRELLLAVWEQWQDDRAALLRPSGGLIAALEREKTPSSKADHGLLDAAFRQVQQSYDETYGGFGRAPKFPAAHNLLYLMEYGQKYGNGDALRMAETTLGNMYAGGLFDHIGGGFCRYSTDRYFLAPHFEKMLYDNALLILAYCRAYEITKSPRYREIAEKTARWICREMTAEDGAFFSAQDADSGGEEGRYYLFEPEEIIRLLGEADGAAFNRHFDITAAGNFEGKNILNCLHGDAFTDAFDPFLPKVYAYRRARSPLHVDDKILTAWNALTIAALCALYRVSRNADCLASAERAQRFIDAHLSEGDVLFVSARCDKRGARGFLDDYAYESFALLALYHATLDEAYLARALALTKRAVTDFFDDERGGFYLYGGEHERLILRPKESGDGAMPSGNSVMAYNLVRLCLLTEDADLQPVLEKQMAFMSAEAERYPAGHAMFLTALSDYLDPPEMVTVVVGAAEDLRELPFLLPLNAVVRVLRAPTDDHPLLNERTTNYVCRGRSCLPPVNDLSSL